MTVDSKSLRPVREIQKATLHLPCEWHEYPKKITVTIVDVYDYGRALPRGLVVHESEVWIVSRYQDHWRLDTKVKDVVANQHGSKFAKWRNYLRRIMRWPWKDEYTQEIKNE